MQKPIDDNSFARGVSRRIQCWLVLLRNSLQNCRQIIRLVWVLISRWRNKPAFVHLMHGDKVTAPYIRNIGNERGDHLFIVVDCYGDAYPIPLLPDVIVVPTKFLGVWNAILHVVARKSVLIVHGLFLEPTISFLAEFRGAAHWVIWGGDLYQYRDLPPPPRVKAIASRFSGLLAGISGDADVFRQVFDVEKDVLPVQYFSPIQLADLRLESGSVRDTIQVNNSVCDSTMEVFDALVGVDLQQLRISTVLSYGAEHEMVSELREAGNRLFGERFCPLENMLTPAGYARHICRVGVMIMNQRRQQGVGNLSFGLATGMVIYVRSDVSTWQYLTDLGATIFDTIELLNDPESLVCALSPADATRNRAIGESLLSVEDTVKVWSHVFKELRRRPPLAC